jgi:hypothetical protein
VHLIDIEVVYRNRGLVKDQGALHLHLRHTRVLQQMLQ